MRRFQRSRSLVAVVAYYLVDLYDDVLGDAGLYGCAINHCVKLMLCSSGYMGISRKVKK